MGQLILSWLVVKPNATKHDPMLMHTPDGGLWGWQVWNNVIIIRMQLTRTDGHGNQRFSKFKSWIFHLIVVHWETKIQIFRLKQTNFAFLDISLNCCTLENRNPNNYLKASYFCFDSLVSSKGQGATSSFVNFLSFSLDFP